jgi:hypothetical protein
VQRSPPFCNDPNVLANTRRKPLFPGAFRLGKVASAAMVRLPRAPAGCPAAEFAAAKPRSPQTDWTVAIDLAGEPWYYDRRETLPTIDHAEDEAT